MYENIIGQRLQMLRDQKGVSQDIAAEACGMSRIALARYEAGVRIPRTDKAAALAEYYNVTVDYILGSTSEQKKDLPSEQEIDDAIVALVSDFTPEEMQRLADFAAGLRAARKT